VLNGHHHEELAAAGGVRVQIGSEIPDRLRGLIGHWKLDENGRETVVADASSSQWDGTRDVNTAEGSVPGKLGQSLRFPAAGSVRLDRHAGVLGKLTDFSLSIWIQYDGGASRQLFTFSDGTMSHRIQVEVHNDCLHFGWQNGGSFAGFGTEKLARTPGNWLRPKISANRPPCSVSTSRSTASEPCSA